MHSSSDLFTALGKTRVTWQTFHDSPNAKGKPRIIHGPLKVRQTELERLNNDGHGIYFMVNDGDMQGRAAVNVKAITAFFIDLDGAPLPETVPLIPSAVVNSSPGRWHLYWRVTDAPLDVFSHVQKHLAVLFDGDTKVHDLPRVMRAPGFQHRKAEPFTSTLLERHELSYSLAEFMDCFAIPPAPPARKPLPAATQAYIDRVKNHGKPVKPRTLDSAVDRVASAPEGQRNHTLFRVTAAVANQVKNGQISQAEAEAELAAAALATGLEEREVAATIRSGMRYAQ